MAVQVPGLAGIAEVEVLDHALPALIAFEGAFEEDRSEDQVCCVPSSCLSCRSPA